MKRIEVLGIGCPNCKKTEKLIRKTLEGKGWTEGNEFTLVKVTDINEISARGVFSTPGVVIDNQVISQGKVPSTNTINEWFS